MDLNDGKANDDGRVSLAGFPEAPYDPYIGSRNETGGNHPERRDPSMSETGSARRPRSNRRNPRRGGRQASNDSRTGPSGSYQGKKQAQRGGRPPTLGDAAGEFGAPDDRQSNEFAANLSNDQAYQDENEYFSNTMKSLDS